MMLLEDIEIQVRELSIDAVLPKAKKFVADTVEKFIPFLESRMLRGDARLMIKQIRTKNPRDIFAMFPPRLAVSVAAALEHFHTVKARKDLKSFDVSKLWTALEQIEHKHVAFNVLREINPDYLFRLLGLLFSLGFIETDIVSFFEALVQYLNPKFHPDKVNETEYKNALKRFERLINNATAVHQAF